MLDGLKVRLGGYLRHTISPVPRHKLHRSRRSNASLSVSMIGSFVPSHGTQDGGPSLRVCSGLRVTDQRKAPRPGIAGTKVGKCPCCRIASKRGSEMRNVMSP